MEVTIKPEEFNFLLDKVKKLKKGERLIKLDDKVSLMFRYSKVRTGNIYKEELMFPVIDPKADNEDIVSLVFDAKGLHNDFITEIGVFREDKTYTMYIVPQREDAVINSFRKLLIEESEGKANAGSIRWKLSFVFPDFYITWDSIDTYLIYCSGPLGVIILENNEIEEDSKGDWNGWKNGWRNNKKIGTNIE